MYGSGLGRAGTAALAVGGVAYTSVWHVAIAVGVILVGGLAVRLSGHLHRAAEVRRHAP